MSLMNSATKQSVKVRILEAAIKSAYAKGEIAAVNLLAPKYREAKKEAGQ